MQQRSKKKENYQSIILIPRTSISNSIKKLKALKLGKAKGNIKTYKIIPVPSSITSVVQVRTLVRRMSSARKKASEKPWSFPCAGKKTTVEFSASVPSPELAGIHAF